MSAVPRRWPTPRLLRAMVGAVWVASALVFLVGLRALNADRAAIRSLSRVTAPSVVATQELVVQLSDLDTALADSLLGGASDRDVATELFELRRSAASRKLVDVANASGVGRADRVPQVVLSEEVGRYLELASTAQWLYLGGDREGALSFMRLATHLMTTRIIFVAGTLDGIDRAQMDGEYESQQRAGTGYEIEALLSGALLVGLLLAPQVLIVSRMRRRVVPFLALATLTSVVFTAYLVGRFNGARKNLSIAHDDAFNSIHFLWKARALAHQANGAQSRWLLDRSRAVDYDTDFHTDMSQLMSRAGSVRVGSAELRSLTGLLIDEAKNTTFVGEEEAANTVLDTFGKYAEVDERVRVQERGGRHAEAVAMALGDGAEQARGAFDRFDAAVMRTVAINQEAFDATAAASDRALGRAEWLDPAFALGIALLAWLGIRGRLREYS